MSILLALVFFSVTPGTGAEVSAIAAVYPRRCTGCESLERTDAREPNSSEPRKNRLANNTITGPDGSPAWNDTRRPIAADAKAMGAAIRVIDQTSRDQKEAATAGNRMRPRAISVPSAWKPATMFSTARAR